ncbi:helix-turn-helix domain-containing protein [Streptomyces sp. NPDC002088]|uniref:helix-turn-helix domain-containing protein n=1 Tax=Streptomyces sp. NPDC002088 TaxID=3154665 RepID=UPI003329C58A
MSILIMSEVFAHSETRLATRLVLLALADAANDTHRMCWESADTIAGKARVSKRQAYASLATLELEGIVEHVPDEEAPLEALRYKSVVRRIKPVVEWPSTSKSADPAPLSSADSAPPVSNFSPNPNIPTGSNRDTSYLQGDALEEGGVNKPGARGWSAVVAPKRGGRRKTRKQVAEEAVLAEKELDPAYVVAQALGEGDPGSGLDNDLPASQGGPAPRVQAPRTARSRRPSEELAEFFDRRAQEVGSDVPGATNLKALVGTFGRWMAQGTERETIRQMIITYWSSSWQRSDNTVAWKDFLAARGLLTQRLGKAASAMEENRFNEDFWS